MRTILAGMLGIDPERLHVIVPDMGGGFGARGTPYPEFALILAAAQRTGRTVRWTATRTESFLSDAQSRDHLLHGALAIDAQGQFTAIRALIEWRHGAYVSPRGFTTMTDYLIPTIGGPYRIPRRLRRDARLPQQTPRRRPAYRGIGRVESNYLTESLVDAAAVATGIDRIDIRRRNLVAPHEMPWTAPGGEVYHGGDFPGRTSTAPSTPSTWRDSRLGARRRPRRGPVARHRGSALRRERRRRSGRLREGRSPRRRLGHGVRRDPELRDGTRDGIRADRSDRLGIDIDAVRFVNGDTARVREGFGSHGSRSARIGGTACVMGADAMIERGRALAGEMLEAASDGIGYDAGVFTVEGTNRSVALAEVAEFAVERGEALSGERRFATERGSLGNGAAACEVEIDPETGASGQSCAMSSSANTGRTINPMLAEGQLHGGAAQGIGQAALEQIVPRPGIPAKP